MKIHFKRKYAVLARFMVLIFLVQGFNAFGGLSAASETASTDSGTAVLSETDDYEEYLQKYSGSPSPVTEIVIPGGGFYSVTDGAQASEYKEFEGRDNVLKWDGSDGSVNWKFRVSESGMYRMKLDYYALNNTADNIQLKMMLDGKKQFEQQEYFTFPRLFHDSSDITEDEAGNDIRPMQEALEKWVGYTAEDIEGNYGEPFKFYLSEGEHTLTLEAVRADLAIDTVIFYNDEPIPDYESYSAGAKAYDGEYSEIYQAETPVEKSDRRLYPQYDKTSADTIPSDPVKQKLNTIGGSNFSSIGQFLTWSVKAPESGYYKIALRVRQNLSVGLTAYRRLLINGKVPFEEANMIPFHFSQKWQNITLGDGENEWLFYLEEGENTITLQVVPGPASGLTAGIEELVSRLNLIYRQIVMVTGTNPDSYRDYQLDREIPGLMDELKLLLEKNNTVLAEASGYGNEVTGDLSSLQELSRMLEGCIENSASIPLKVSSLQSYGSTLSALVSSIRDMPLELDYIIVSSREPDSMFSDSGFFGQMVFELKAFIGSFFTDYNTVGVTDGAEKKVTVWVSLGRDQTQTVKLLAASTFTPETDISVDIKLVQQSLVYASLSGRGPDVVLFVEEGDPVNLALRGALAPMDGFSGFEEIKSRFSEQALVPFQHDGKTYALPLQQNFPMLFYRTDIFRELELEVPETWDDFYNVIQVLQRNNMTAGLPNMDSGSAMSTNNKIFAMFLSQMGGTYYNEDLSRTALDSNTAVSAFTMWTDFYRDYGLEYQYDFYNRFVTGQMPIGISTYTIYNQLMTAANEIRGEWEMAPVPGTVDKDGVLHSEVCGTVTGAVILERCRDKQSAWKFIDWFTRADTQAAFGLEIETLLGPAGRYDTANLEAFDMLPWTETEKKLIKTQWQNTFQLAQVPGGYYVDRNLTNAFRQVVFYGKNPRETLMNYNQKINREIERKRVEFGLE